MNFDYPIASNVTRETLRLAMRDRAEQFQIWLMEGQLTKLVETIDRMPAALADLVPIVANPEANMNVRLGAGAAFERYAGTMALRALVPHLGKLTTHEDARVRADACHVLGLSGTQIARPYLEARQNDPDAEVRDIVADSLAELNLSKENP